MLSKQKSDTKKILNLLVDFWIIKLYRGLEPLENGWLLVTAIPHFFLQKQSGLYPLTNLGKVKPNQMTA